jgi:hypothetical protein
MAGRWCPASPAWAGVGVAQVLCWQEIQLHSLGWKLWDFPTCTCYGGADITSLGYCSASCMAGVAEALILAGLAACSRLSTYLSHTNASVSHNNVDTVLPLPMHGPDSDVPSL